MLHFFDQTAVYVNKHRLSVNYSVGMKCVTLLPVTVYYGINALEPDKSYMSALVSYSDETATQLQQPHA